MTDQCEITFPKTRVEEDSAFDLVAHFRTRTNGFLKAPFALRYKVDCLTTKTALVGWTSVTVGTDVTIVMSAAVNKIQDASNKWERKQITVQSDLGTDDQLTKTRNWKVFNVWGIGI